MKLLPSIVLLLAAPLAFSQPPEIRTAPSSPEPENVQQANPFDFCYADGKAYSEGYLLNGRVCERQHVVVINHGDGPRRLVWYLQKLAVNP